jgi:hypothetical protein
MTEAQIPSLVHCSSLLLDYELRGSIIEGPWQLFTSNPLARLVLSSTFSKVELAPCWFGAAKTDLSLLFFKRQSTVRARHHITAGIGGKNPLHNNNRMPIVGQANVLNASTGNFPE